MQILAVQVGIVQIKTGLDTRVSNSGTLLKSGNLSGVFLSSVNMVADGHRYAAYHNKH